MKLSLKIPLVFFLLFTAFLIFNHFYFGFQASVSVIIFIQGALISFVLGMLLKNQLDNALQKLIKINSPEIINIDAERQSYEDKVITFQKIKSELRSFSLKEYPKEIEDVSNMLEQINDRILRELELSKSFKINRNEFLGNVAHELRTPIFAIQLSLETLLDGAINDEKVNKDFLNRAMKQADRLKELVTDLISISKIEAGIKLSKRYFNIKEFIEGIINELSGLALKKGGEIILKDNTAPQTEVLADAERIKQVLINLIENSIKYSKDNEPCMIIITADEVGKDVKITVKDNGIGIPKEDISRIFERFYRVEKNRSREYGGSGLGLSIVKHILEAHSSSIKVESTINEGSSFSFILPK